jgi:hypothetical protein
MMRCLLPLLAMAAAPALAGGSNYNVVPGALSHSGKIGVID